MDAFAALILQPVERQLLHFKDPIIKFGKKGAIKVNDLQFHGRRSSIQGKTDILVVDSGAAATHSLAIIFCRHKVPPLFATASHWYRLSILKQFLQQVEFYLDIDGLPVDIAIGSWSHEGLDEIFRTQKTRLGGRTKPRCLMDNKDIHETSKDDDDDEEEGQQDEWKGSMGVQGMLSMMRSAVGGRRRKIPELF